MPVKMKELPISERPYEKLELYGERSLSNAELLAIIIKTGTKSETSISLAQNILNLRKDSDTDNLRFLHDISINEFMRVKGIGKVKAIQLKAVCELTKRISKPINSKKIVIKTAEDVAKLLMPEMKFEKKEIAKIILLNNKNVVLRIIDISIRRFEFRMYRTYVCTFRSNKNAGHQR